MVFIVGKIMMIGYTNFYSIYLFLFLKLTEEGSSKKIFGGISSCKTCSLYTAATIV